MSQTGSLDVLGNLNVKSVVNVTDDGVGNGRIQVWDDANSVYRNIDGIAGGFKVDNYLEVSGDLRVEDDLTVVGSVDITPDNVTIGTYVLTVAGTASIIGTNTGDQNLFSQVSVSGQTDVTADSPTTTLNFIAGSNVTISTDGASNSITFNATPPGVADGDYGDITVSSSGTVWTIDNGVVTFAKMQSVSADILLGNDSSGTEVEEIPCTAAGRALIDDVDAEAQRTTLGLGTAAVKDTGTSGDAVPLLNVANLWSEAQTFINGNGVRILDTGNNNTLGFTVGEDLSADRTLNFITGDADRTLTFTDNASIGGTNTGDQNLFLTIAVSGQFDIVADSTTDTLTFAAGTNVTITTDDTTDTITINSATVVPDGDYGDITVSSSGTVWTIDNGVVTFAKMQTVSTDVLLGNDSSGTEVEEIPCTAAGRALLDDADVAAQRTTLELGTAALEDIGTSGTTVPLLDGANSWSAAQRFINSSGVTILDNDNSNVLGFVVLENLSADRGLNIVTGDADRTLTFTADASIGGTNTGDQNLFLTIAVSGQSDVVADSTTDTLTLVAGTGVTITTDDTTDSITINSTGAPADGDYGDITVSSSGTVWTIDNGVVTPAKMDDGTAHSILGRAAATSGVRADIVPADLANIGFLLYRPDTPTLEFWTGGTTVGILQIQDSTTAPVVQAFGSYGDLTTTSSTYTINANAVTFAKMQAVSANIILGNDASGTAVEEITCTAAGRDLLDDADASAQRTTLGLGTAALEDIGTSGNTVPLLDGNNTWSGNSIFDGFARFTAFVSLADGGLVHPLNLSFGETLTAARNLSFVVGDADRTLTFTANASIGGTNTGDQTSVTGNAGTATALQNPRTIGGVSFDGTANIVPQTIESANEATDATCFPLFITASGTQSLQPKNNTGFTYNSATNVLTVTTFSGGLAGNANTASTLVSARLINGTSFNGSADILAPDYSNIIDNGNFAVWQRGATFTSIATGAYSADRYSYQQPAGAAVHTITQSTDVPTVAQSGSLSLYSLKIDCTTADASIAATDRCFLNHAIEGFDFLAIAQRAFTLSFWVKATKTGIYCVAFRNSGADRSYIAEYTVNTTATWEYKTITVAASPTGGTWDYTTGVGLNVVWTLFCGSTYQTTANAWQTGNFVGTSSQVNAADSTANDFYLSQIMIVPGSTAYPIQPKSYAEDLAKCQRYAQVYSGHMLGLAFNTNALSTYGMGLITEMRIAPSMASGATFSVNAGSAGTPSIGFRQTKSIGLSNASNNWTATAIVQFSGTLTADI